MPLDRAHVTEALRVLIPWLPVLAFVLGADYLTMDRAKIEQVTVYSTADSIMPMSAWGAMFLTCSAVLVTAMLLHNRAVYAAAVSLLFAALTVWTGIFLYSIVDEGASPSAWIWPATGAVVAVAVIRSLQTRERS